MKQHYSLFWQKLDDPRFDTWQTQLPALIETALHPQGNGNLPKWLSALDTLYTFDTDQPCDLSLSAIQAGLDNLTPKSKTQLETALRQLMPWRKGPFTVHGIEIETEWQSDWKWDRVFPHLSPLKNRRILDIGCGSGYHIWRMANEQPQLAIGVDPSLLSMSQFLALKHFIGEGVPAYFLPLTLEQLPVSHKGGAFDTVFSMGVLYHRRSPIDHIYDLKNQLLPGGELVLETLVMPESYGPLLVPKDRYAQMRNVWFLPSVNTLTNWIERCGFVNVRCVDINQTTVKEQRTTDWMTWNSLSDFLDPNDSNKTAEGYPAPLRAVMIANKPE